MATELTDVHRQTEDRMRKAIEATRSEFATVRTGRASTALLDRIMVDYYGTPTPINQLASISVPEPRMLLVQPWDRTSVQAIERAVLKSDLGLTPSNDGSAIRLPIPQLTEERRRELLRVVRGMSEDGRVAVRNIRRDANEDIRRMEKDHLISKDDLQRNQEKVQKLTDKFIEEIDHMLANKEKELLEV